MHLPDDVAEALFALTGRERLWNLLLEMQNLAENITDRTLR